MMQLAENFGSVDVQALDHAGKRFDVPVGRHGQLARQARAMVFIDACNAGDQQPQAVFSPGFIVVNQLLRGCTVKTGHPHFQGRQNHTVAHRHRAYPAFRKQELIWHHAFSITVDRRPPIPSRAR